MQPCHQLSTKKHKSIDRREQIDIGPERQAIDGADGYWRLQGPSLWPTTPGSRAASTNWDRPLIGGRAAIAADRAVSLGAAEDTFDAAFADPPTPD